MKHIKSPLLFYFLGISLVSLQAVDSDSAVARLEQNRMSWTATGPLVFPSGDPTISGIIAYKDPSVVRSNDRWHLFVSRVTNDNGKAHYSLAYLEFADWDSAAKQMKVYPLFENEKEVTAPQVFYFRPQKKWYLFYRWHDRLSNLGGPAYSTMDDIDKPETISKPTMCFSYRPDLPTTKGVGWLDFWVIADEKNVYLFSTDDAGDFMRSETTIQNFPAGWSQPVVAIHGTTSEVFEGSCTYTLKDRKQYLTIIEAIDPTNGNRRFYSSYLSDRLDGTWRPTGSTANHPFAGAGNIHFAAGTSPWTTSISHGELIRSSNDETLLLDPTNITFLYQGWDGKTRIAGLPKGYHYIPWKLGLLHCDPLQESP